MCKLLLAFATTDLLGTISVTGAPAEARVSIIIRVATGNIITAARI